MKIRADVVANPSEDFDGAQKRGLDAGATRILGFGYMLSAWAMEAL
ncbi:MAG: hypothetical protein WA734_19645 [Candidatus Acidiferrales bacterium]